MFDDNLGMSDGNLSDEGAGVLEAKAILEDWVPQRDPTPLPHAEACLCCCHFAVDLEAADLDAGGRGRSRRRNRATAAKEAFLLLT